MPAKNRRAKAGIFIFLVDRSKFTGVKILIFANLLKEKGKADGETGRSQGLYTLRKFSIPNYFLCVILEQYDIQKAICN